MWQLNAWKKIDVVSVLSQRFCVIRTDKQLRYDAWQDVCCFEELIPLDEEISQPKRISIFTYLSTKTYIWNTLEAPHRGSTNKSHQHQFSQKNKKNLYLHSPYILSSKHYISGRYKQSLWKGQTINVSFFIPIFYKCKQKLIRNESWSCISILWLMSLN